MNIIEILINRRSIRRYTGQEIEDTILQEVIKAGMYAPSAVNKQPWHFILVRNKQQLNRIASVHPYASMLPGASAAIVVCGDEQLANTPAYWPVDCAAATENMLIAAHGLGLGGVWLGVYPREERIEAIAKLFELPGHIHPFAIISLGYPAEAKPLPDRFKAERIHFETWK
jgi:nitroreductase